MGFLVFGHFLGPHYAVNGGERAAKNQDPFSSSGSSFLKVVGGTENPHTHFFSGCDVWRDTLDLVSFNVPVYIVKEHLCGWKREIQELSKVLPIGVQNRSDEDGIGVSRPDAFSNSG